jgi:hypothetical protein
MAVTATDAAHDEDTVRTAAKELWDANMAINQVMP